MKTTVRSLSSLIYIFNKKPFHFWILESNQERSKSQIFRSKICEKHFTSKSCLNCAQRESSRSWTWHEIKYSICLILVNKNIFECQVYCLKTFFLTLYVSTSLKSSAKIWNLKNIWRILRFFKIALHHISFNEQENLLAFVFSLIYNWDAQQEFVQIKTL